ncbi:hypothetical protein [Bacillus cereus]|uniref:hypothetical protein n=1 Tax=Bacillus cereus TaxID=1396 RepID=UPI001F414E4B|nr:hypothetical protein [Bacillus cereus]BCC32533.1 hypothetical protein BCM0100_5259 [Bacillus cereus]
MDIKSLGDLISKLIGLPIVISLASLIFLIVNNVNIRDVEKMLLTNYQRLQIFIGNIFINFIIYTSIFLGLLAYEDLIHQDNIQVTLLVVGAMALIVSFIVYMPIQIGVYFNPIITKVFIGPKGDRWGLLRVAGKSKVLLRKKTEGNEGYHDVITYHNLDSIKEKEIGLQYKLKTNIYYNTLRKSSTWGSYKNLFCRILGSIAIIGINKCLICIYPNEIFIFIVTLFTFSIIIIVNMHISFLRKAKKLHPEIFVD